MGKLVEFELADGGSVLVEVPAESTAGSGPVLRGLGASDVPERAQRTFEEAVARIQPAVAAVIGRLKAMPEEPAEVHVEFGLDLHAEVGAFISASTTANFTVSLTWRRPQAPS